jgi:glucokinase
MAVGVDIGGTKVLAGVVDARGRVVKRTRSETPGRTEDPRVVEDTIVAAVKELARHHDISVVGVGAAGFVDAQRSTVLFAPHLSWRNEPLRERLESRLDIPVIIDNDANATALAEVRFGAGRGAGVVLCVTLGTGIGGAIVVNDQLFRGAHGLAGEFGHTQLVPGGLRCECGNRGCWEQYASGNALVREARGLVAAKSPAASALRERCRDDASGLTGPMITSCATEGDQTSRELLHDVGTHLGVGLASLCAALDPERIVVGGGLSEAGDLLLGSARVALGRNLTGRGFRPTPDIVAAELGADAGFIGAAEMARQDLRLRTPSRVLVRLRARALNADRTEPAPSRAVRGTARRR